jgi:hypothetical protein
MAERAEGTTGPHQDAPEASEPPTPVPAGGSTRVPSDPLVGLFPAPLALFT